MQNLHNYEIVSHKSYVNSSIVTCSNRKLLENEFKKIEKIVIDNGFKKEIAQKISKKD